MKRGKIHFNAHPSQNVIDFGADSTPEYTAASYNDASSAIHKPHVSSHCFRYLCMGSGSSGNCSYLGTQQGGILIDAGVKPDFVEQSLKDNGISLDSIKGILLTHDHNDHIQYVYRLLRGQRNLRLFCTNRVINGLMQRHNISKRIREYHTPIFKEIPFKILNFEITAFDVPHDGTDNMGFNITLGDRNFVIATDMGAVSERAYHYISRANFLVVEANYDLAMLHNGRYPEYLKARIQTQNGHMDNVMTAQLLTRIAGHGLEYVFLCHLSKDNNTPEVALATVGGALARAGFKVGADTETIADREADLILTALPRFEATRLYVLR